MEPTCSPSSESTSTPLFTSFVINYNMEWVGTYLLPKFRVNLHPTVYFLCQQLQHRNGTYLLSKLRVNLHPTVYFLCHQLQHGMSWDLPAPQVPSQPPPHCLLPLSTNYNIEMEPTCSPSSESTSTPMFTSFVINYNMEWIGNLPALQAPSQPPPHCLLPLSSTTTWNELEPTCSPSSESTSTPLFTSFVINYNIEMEPTCSPSSESTSTPLFTSFVINYNMEWVTYLLSKLRVNLHPTVYFLCHQLQHRNGTYLLSKLRVNLHPTVYFLCYQLQHRNGTYLLSKLRVNLHPNVYFLCHQLHMEWVGTYLLSKLRVNLHPTVYFLCHQLQHGMSRNLPALQAPSQPPPHCLLPLSSTPTWNELEPTCSPSSESTSTPLFTSFVINYNMEWVGTYLLSKLRVNLHPTVYFLCYQLQHRMSWNLPVLQAPSQPPPHVYFRCHQLQHRMSWNLPALQALSQPPPHCLLPLSSTTTCNELEPTCSPSSESTSTPLFTSFVINYNIEMEPTCSPSSESTSTPLFTSFVINYNMEWVGTYLLSKLRVNLHPTVYFLCHQLQHAMCWNLPALQALSQPPPHCLLPLSSTTTWNELEPTCSPKLRVNLHPTVYFLCHQLQHRMSWNLPALQAPSQPPPHCLLPLSSTTT